MKLPADVGPILIIVSRDEAWLYPVLRDQFAEDDRVEVLIDRRFAERRHRDEPPTHERRRQDRRQTDLSSALRFRGWATVRHRRDAVDSGAERTA
jgi:hypothetical protein